jgi:hypothetical protein
MAGYLMLNLVALAGSGWFSDNLFSLLASLHNTLGLSLFARASGPLVLSHGMMPGWGGPVGGDTQRGGGQQQRSYKGEASH